MLKIEMKIFLIILLNTITQMSTYNKTQLQEMNSSRTMGFTPFLI